MRRETPNVIESREYDGFARLAKIGHSHEDATSATRTRSFTYAYNAANQRTAVTHEDNTRWDYGYDALGQVTVSVMRSAPVGAAS